MKTLVFTADGMTLTAEPEKRAKVLSSMETERAETTRTPSSPVPTPKKSKPRRITSSVGPAFTTTPFVPLTRMPPCTLLASIVMDLVIVTAPKPPESSALISPPMAVLPMAPANVLQGAVRERHDVVANTGNPRAGRLSECRRCKRHTRSDEQQRAQQSRE